MDTRTAFRINCQYFIPPPLLPLTGDLPGLGRAAGLGRRAWVAKEEEEKEKSRDSRDGGGKGRGWFTTVR